MKNRNLLAVKLGPIKLNNPVMTASGTFDIHCTDLTPAELGELGALVPKSISFTIREGNPAPRIYETTAGMLNAVGIPSKGVKNFVQEELPLLYRANQTIIVSISGHSAQEFCQLTEYLADYGEIAALEINLSCPNLNDAMPFGSNKTKMYEVISRIRERTEKPLLVKLSPNVTDITEMAFIAANAGADILTVANTFTGMAIDIERQEPTLGNIKGGLSGPAIRPIIVRMVWEIAGALDIPVVGVGGICTAEDAIEMLLAGASAVQIGSACFNNPRIMNEIIAGIGEYLIKKGYRSVEEIIGLGQRK